MDMRTCRYACRARREGIRLKMKKKILTCIVLMTTILATGCGMTAGGANESDGLATEEQIAAVKDALGDNMNELKFSVDGVVFQYPMTMQEMLDADWYLDSSVKNELKTLEENTRTSGFVLRKNRSGEYGITECSVVAGNESSFEKEIGETDLYNLTFRREKGMVLILPQGLTWDSTYEDVCEAYQPGADYRTDQDGILTITFTNASYDGHLVMRFDAQTRELSELKFY